MQEASLWATSLREIGSVNQVHAVGALALLSNRLEMSVYSLVRWYFPDHPDYRTFLFATLHNSAKSDLIEILSAREDSEAQEAVLHALRCFSICTENRNIVLHATSDEYSDTHLKLVKQNKKNHSMMSAYVFTTEQLREAAESAYLVGSYFFDVKNYLEDVSEGRPRALPDRPPLPRKLSLSLLPAAPTGG